VKLFSTYPKATITNKTRGVEAAILMAAFDLGVTNI
jgi:hypothetical protein